MANFKFASQVHIAPNRCDVEDSTKSGERSRLSQRTSIEIKIQSREMKLPTSLKRYLCSGKTNLSCWGFYFLIVGVWEPTRTTQGWPNTHSSITVKMGQRWKLTRRWTEKTFIPLRPRGQEADSKMFVRCEYIANQVSDWILPRGSSFFPRHRCGSFMLVSL